MQRKESFSPSNIMRNKNSRNFKKTKSDQSLKIKKEIDAKLTNEKFFNVQTARSNNINVNTSTYNNYCDKKDEKDSPSNILLKNNIFLSEKKTFNELNNMDTNNSNNSKIYNSVKDNLKQNYDFHLKKEFVVEKNKQIKKNNIPKSVKNNILCPSIQTCPNALINNLRGFLNFNDKSLNKTNNNTNKNINIPQQNKLDKNNLSSQYNTYKKLSIQKDEISSSDIKFKSQNKNLINFLSKSKILNRANLVLSKNKIEKINANIVDNNNTLHIENIEKSFKKNSNVSSSNTTFIGNSVSNLIKYKRQSRPTEISINLNDTIDLKILNKNEINTVKNKKTNINNLFEEKKNNEDKSDSKMIGHDNLKNLLDYSYENIFINKEIENSDSGRISTKRSEFCEKNDFLMIERFFEKLNKKDIMFTNEICFDTVDEKFKNMIFKKNY